LIQNKRSKTLGQNFLIDKNIVFKILKAAEITHNDTVIEIGPGKGALTDELIKTSGKIICVEIDNELAANLADKYSIFSNITIVNENFIFTDISAFLTQNTIFIGNLPYSVSTRIISKTLLFNKFIKHCVFMIQKEVAQRICATPESGKIHGALSILTRAHFQPEYLFDVSSNCFSPKPEVISSVIKLMPVNRNLPGDFNYNLFEKFVFSAFANKRKTLINSILNNSSINKETISNALLSLNLNPDIRAEQIGIEGFLKMFEKIYKSL